MDDLQDIATRDFKNALEHDLEIEECDLQDTPEVEECNIGENLVDEVEQFLILPLRIPKRGQPKGNYKINICFILMYYNYCGI